MDDARYNELIELIYDAALDPVHWDAVIHRLREDFQSIAAGFFVQTADQRLDGSYGIGLDKSEMEKYGQHFAQNNPWFTTPGLMKPGRVLTDRSLEILHQNRLAFLNTEMYQDWCRAQDFRHAMGGSLIDRDGNLLNFTFFRAAIHGHYSDVEITRYQSLCRHLMKAVEINCRIAEKTPNLVNESRCLDLLRLGVVFLNKQGRIVDANKYAMTVLANKLGLCEKDARVKAMDDDSQARLDRFVDQACKEQKSALMMLPKQNGSALSLCIVPQPERRRLLPPAAVVATLFISDQDDIPITQIAYLTERWKFTPAEAQFATLMMHGNSVSDIAKELQLTENTARWYSKQIMQKLGVKRQAEAILKLMNDFPMFLNVVAGNASYEDFFKPD